VKKIPTNELIPISNIGNIFTVFTGNFSIKVVFSNSSGDIKSNEIGKNHNGKFDLSTIHFKVAFVEFVSDDPNINGVDVSVS